MNYNLANLSVFASDLSQAVLTEYSDLLREDQLRKRETSQGRCYFFKGLRLQSIMPLLLSNPGDYIIRRENGDFLMERIGAETLLVE